MSTSDKKGARERWLLPEGIEEILPDEARRLESLRRRLLDLFASWGYELAHAAAHRVSRIAAHGQRARPRPANLQAHRSAHLPAHGRAPGYDAAGRAHRRALSQAQRAGCGCATPATCRARVRTNSKVRASRRKSVPNFSAAPAPGGRRRDSRTRDRGAQICRIFARCTSTLGHGGVFFARLRPRRSLTRTPRPSLFARLAAQGAQRRRHAAGRR